MIPFLEKISERLLSKFPNNLHNVKVVLPSKRASIFLKSHISKKINKAVFLPEIISIEDFLIKISDLQILDNISLQFMLYEIYSTKKGNSAESFDEFINWSNIVLNDFNEIDKNCSSKTNKINAFMLIKPRVFHRQDRLGHDLWNVCQRGSVLGALSGIYLRE